MLGFRPVVPESSVAPLDYGSGRPLLHLRSFELFNASSLSARLPIVVRSPLFIAAWTSAMICASEYGGLTQPGPNADAFRIAETAARSRIFVLPLRPGPPPPCSAVSKVSL